MARLLHEVWFEAEGLPGCVLAGPPGDDARGLFLSRGARLVHTFEAGSYFEAMQLYNAFPGLEPYTTSYPELDKADYPVEWLEEQRSGSGRAS